jgi:hypothetical protein
MSVSPDFAFRSVADANAALARSGSDIEVRKHVGGGLFYIVSKRWRGEPGSRDKYGPRYAPEDGAAILNSAMGLRWALDDALGYVRRQAAVRPVHGVV